MSSSSSLTSSNEEKPNMLRSPKDQRKTQEYLLLNYPRDVRKNLKDLVFPDDVEKMTGNTKKGSIASVCFGLYCAVHRANQYSLAFTNLTILWIF